MTDLTSSGAWAKGLAAYHEFTGIELRPVMPGRCANPLATTLALRLDPGPATNKD